MVENEDVDYFAVEAKKGERITAEIEGLRLGYTFFDPYVAILDTKRFELARSDDAPLVRQDCIASIVAPEDGTYIIAGPRNVVRRQRLLPAIGLHVGRFPRPTAVLPARRQAGRNARRRSGWATWPAPQTEEGHACRRSCRAEFGMFAQDDQRHLALGQSVSL